MSTIMEKIKKELNKLNNLPEAVKSGLWFTICGFLQKGIAMLSTPIFTRTLSEKEYGITSTFLAWQVIINLLVTLTLYRSIMNLYVKYDNKEKVLGYVAGLSITVSTAWTIFAVIFLDPLSRIMNLSKPLVLCLFLYSIGESIIQCWMMYKRYVYDYKKAVFITLLLSAISCFGGVGCVLLIDATAEWRLYPQTIAYLIIGIFLFFIICIRERAFYKKEIWTFSLGFCIGLMPHYISEFILQSSDKIMINYMCGAEDVAMYSVAYAVGSLIALFANAVNSAFVPYQYQKIQAKECKELSKTANNVQFMLAVILSLLMLFGEEIVLIFGGYKYISCADVIVPICLGVYFNYMFQMFARVQEYYNRKLTIVIPSIACAILNVILNYIFIAKYGYKAASYTTFVCFALFCLIHYFFYLRTCRNFNQNELIYDGKTLLIISIGITFIGAVILAIQDNVWLKYTIIILMLIAIIIKRNKVKDIIYSMMKPR